MKKIYDLAVKTGTYQKAGEEKGKYLNVGAILESENGKFILLNKTFNPAGIIDDRDSVIISMFKPKKSDNETLAPQKDIENPFIDDDIPF